MKYRKYIYAVIITFLILSLSLYIYSLSQTSMPNITFSPEELAWIKQHPIIKVAPDFNFAPYEYYEDGQFYGLGVSHIQWIEKNSPLKFEFVAIDNWPGILDALRERKVDISTAIAPTEQRKDYLLFTESYMTIENIILIRNDFEMVFTENDLPKMKTAVLKDYYIQDILENKFPSIQLQKYVNVTDALNALSLGETDVLILDVGQASYYIGQSELGNLEIYEEFELDYKLEMAMGIRNDYKILRNILDKILINMPEAEREKIKNEWIELDGVNPYIEILFVVSSVIAITSLLILVIVTAWNRSLNKSIQQKTAIIQSDLETMSLLRMQLSNVINAIPMPIYVTTYDGNYIYLNDSYAALHKVSSQTLINQESNDFELDLKEEDLRRLVLSDHKIKKGQERQIISEVCIQTSQDQKRIYDIIKLPFHFDKASQNGILTVMMDVTDRIKAERDLHQLNAQLENKVDERTQEIQEKNQALEASIQQLHETQGKLLESEKLASLSRLVVGIAHSLNTPLGNAILSSSFLTKKHKELDELFKTGNLTKSSFSDFITEASQSSLILDNSLNEASSIIDVLRSYQLMQDDSQRNKVHLKDYVKHTLELENFQYNYPIEIIGSNQLIVTNTFLLDKIISNIYNNIVEHAFTEKERKDCLIHVKCQVRDHEVLLSFMDNGKGISEEVLSHVTEPLYSTKRGQGRLGLGLYVVHNIISNVFKGTLTINNNEDQGITITLQFPILE